MRGWIILVVAVAAMLALTYLGTERLYLTPVETADQRIDDLAAQLAGLRERETLARRELAALQRDGHHPSDLKLAWTGDPDAAASELQEYVRAAVAQSGGLAASSQVMIGELAGGYAKVSVLLRIRMAERQLLDFLRKVETRLPPVIVDSLEVRLLPQSPDSRQLDVTATVTAFTGNADAR